LKNLKRVKQLAQEEYDRIRRLNKRIMTTSEYFWLCDYANRIGDKWFDERTMGHLLKKEIK